MSALKYSPSAIIRTLPGNKLAGIRQQTFSIGAPSFDFELSLADAAVLELFAFYAEPEEVWRQFGLLDYKNGLTSFYENLCKAEPRLAQAKFLRIYFGKRTVQCTGFLGDNRGSGNALWKGDLSAYAEKDPRVGVAALMSRMEGSFVEKDGYADYAKFSARVQALREAGFIAPDVGGLNWGDLRRQQPLCQFFGFMRGTPVDRYYLDCFVESIRGEVRGVTLEIGGEKKNRDSYGFKHVTEYRILDLPGLSDDIAGNVADPRVFSESSFDSVVLFNVLEHCEQPQRVIDNIHRWLKPGGKAFVLVPSAQRIHPAPGDYWRLLPQGLQSLGKAFRRCKARTYGNLTAVIAALQGVGAEELSPEELDFIHPDYPVVSCLIAEK